MSGQSRIPVIQQKAAGVQSRAFLLLEHQDLLKKFVGLQEKIGSQEPQIQIDLLKAQVAQLEDAIPQLQYKLGETSYCPSSRLDHARQEVAGLERANAELSDRISKLQSSAKNEHYQCELLQKKVVELETQKQKQESNVKSLEAKIIDLSDSVAEFQADADSEHKQREALQKEHDQFKSDRRTQLQKLESVVRSQESDIKCLTDENAALSKEIIQARDRAKDANGSVLDAQQVTSMAEDAYIDLQMQKDHDELSRKYGTNDAESVAKRFEHLETVIEDQAAQIHRLEIDLEEMDILQETKQELEKEVRKLKDDGQQWKEASQSMAEDNQKLEEHIQTLGEDNQESKDDHRTAKVNSEKLKQENQKLKAASEEGHQFTVSSGVDEATMKWVLRARDETLKLERDLDFLEAAWYGDEAALEHGGEVSLRPVSAPATSVVQENVQERDSNSNSFAQSRQSSEVDEPQTMMEVWARQVASYPPSAGIQSWRNSQSQPGSRPGSRLGYSSIYTPSQRSRPASLVGIPKALPSARFGLVSRGTDTPSQRLNRHSLQSRRSSITFPRNTSSNAVPTLADLKLKRDSENFYSYFPHLPRGEVPYLQVPSPEAPKPPSPAQYHPGMESRDFAVEAAQSSQKSLAFYRHNGVQIMEEARAPVRPLHRGRKASLSTISERSESVFSPRRSDSRMRAWLTDDEIRRSRPGGLCDTGTQTEAQETSASPLFLDLMTQVQSLALTVLDQGTQTDSLTPVKPVLAYDQETQTAFEDAATAAIDEQSTTVPPASVYHSEGIQSSREDVLDSEPDTPSLETTNTTSLYAESQPTLEHQSAQPMGPQTATTLPELMIQNTAIQQSTASFKADTADAMTPNDKDFENKAVQTRGSIAPNAVERGTQTEVVESAELVVETAAAQATNSVSKADKATAMTPKESVFERESSQTTGGVAFGAADRGTETDMVNIAELPAPVPTASSHEHVSTSRSISTETIPRTPGSRVAATAQLFEKANSNKKGTGAKLAVLTSHSAQSLANRGPSVPTTPTTLFTASPYLPFARNDAVTRSLRPPSGAKQIESGEHLAVQQDPAALRAEEQNATSTAFLPARAYEQEQTAAGQATLTTLDVGVQTSPTVAKHSATPIPELSQVIQVYSQSDSTLDSPDISPPSTITWETPDDNPYPTPGFYTHPWRSPITPDYSGLEVVTGASLHDSDKVLVTLGQEDSHEAEPHASAVEEVTTIPPEDFARTAMPSPGEIDSDSDDSDEEDVPQISPGRRLSEDLSQVSDLDESRDSENQPLSEPPASQVASPSPVEVPAYEIISAVKQLTHRSRPSTSPVSPEDAWQLQVVKYNNAGALPSPEPPLDVMPRADVQERSALEIERNRQEMPVLRSLMLPQAGTPRQLDSPIVPFPDFDDQLFESPSEYSHSPYWSQRNARAPELSAMDDNQPAQLWQPPHRPPPLDLLRSGSVAATVTPPIDPIDSPYAPDSSQHNKKRFRFQAFAALEGMAETPDYDRDHDVASHDRGSSALSMQSSVRTFAGSSARPSPLRFGNTRFPQPRPEEPAVSEIGATSPTTPKSSQPAFFHKPTSSIQQRRHKKAASLPATAAPLIAGLLEWHPSLSVVNRSPIPMVQEEAPETSNTITEEDAQGSSTTDKSTNTPTFPGGFKTPPALDLQDLDHLPLPILPLIVAHIPQLFREAKNVRWHVSIDWSKLWWTLLWVAMLAYFLFNFWLSILLRDHIDDWKSANVSSRKYNHIVMARDEYWGNSWWKLIEFWMAGGLGGSMELFV